VDSRVICLKKDEDCSLCEDRGVSCLPRWWIAFQPVDSELIYAHTLSLTGSTNFNIYANVLLKEGLMPSQVTPGIFVEEARRKKTNVLYRRVQFERADGEQPPS
jgi:hypothetical protein